MSITVITTAERTELTTVATVKLAVGISGVEQDGNIERLIRAATNAIEEYIGHTLARQTYQEKVAGTDHPYLTLTQTPIVSVAEVLADSSPVTDYVVHDSQAGILYRQAGWTRSAWIGWSIESVAVPGTAEKDIYITYTAGYQMPGESDRDLPDRFEEACVLTVSAWLRRAERGGSDVESERVGDLAVSYRDTSDSSIPPEARALLGQRAA